MFMFYYHDIVFCIKIDKREGFLCFASIVNTSIHNFATYKHESLMHINEYRLFSSISYSYSLTLLGLERGQPSLVRTIG